MLFAVEYALIGLVAGVLGVAGGAVIARQVVVEQMELEWRAFRARWARRWRWPSR